MGKLTASETSSINVKELVAKFYEAMNDDFNAPILLANIFEAVKFINSVNDGKAAISADDLTLLHREINAFVVDVLGFAQGSADSESRLAPVMDLLLDLRHAARETKDWPTSDKIRDGLAGAGITVKDSKEGTSWN
jgi:cysteinyl-tRNA synthetase